MLDLVRHAIYWPRQLSLNLGFGGWTSGTRSELVCWSGTKRPVCSQIIYVYSLNCRSLCSTRVQHPARVELVRCTATMVWGWSCLSFIAGPDCVIVAGALPWWCCCCRLVSCPTLYPLILALLSCFNLFVLLRFFFYRLWILVAWWISPELDWFPYNVVFLSFVSESRTAGRWYARWQPEQNGFLVL